MSNILKSDSLSQLSKEVPLTPSVVRVAEKVEKASETSMLRGALSTHQLLDLGDAEVARKRRKKRVVRLFKNMVKFEYIMLGSRLRQRMRRKIEWLICD